MPELDQRARGAQPDAGTRAVCRAPDPIAVIEEEHALQLELCDVLEYLADSLPSAIDEGLASVAVAILRNGLPRHMSLEEEVLFPLLRRRIAGTPHLTAMLHRLEDEHDTDEGFASEIADALESLAGREAADDAEMLGYMLRGFFECQRRHIAWENEVVLPLARQVLLPEDLAEFQLRIMTSGRPLCARRPLMEIRRAGGGVRACGTCAAGSRTWLS